MKKIVFYTENFWALGNIHAALCKLLYAQGFNCELLDFNLEYSREQMCHIADAADCIVTNYPSKLINYYGVTASKIVFTAHGQWDILLAQKELGSNFDILAGYAVVGDILKEKSLEFGITRQPSLVNVGIFFDRYYQPAADSLNSVGYAAAMQTVNFWGQEIKRGVLVEQVAHRLEIPFKKAQHCHFLAMPHFYHQTDAIVMSSIEESVGLPMMESAAAGKLTVGTPVGYFEKHGPLGGGIVLPVQADEYCDSLYTTLDYYRKYSDEYKKKCCEIQDYARENYDWSKHISSWVDFFANC